MTGEAAPGSGPKSLRGAGRDVLAVLAPPADRRRPPWTISPVAVAEICLEPENSFQERIAPPTRIGYTPAVAHP